MLLICGFSGCFRNYIMFSVPTHSTTALLHTVTLLECEVTPSEPHSTSRTISDKPVKPDPEFPLTAHPACHACK